MQSAVIPTAVPSVCPSVRPSVRSTVCPSVTRWYHIQTNKERIMRSSLQGSKNTLVLWYQQWLGATSPSTKNLRSKWPTPLKSADFDQYLLITSQTYELAKKVHSSRIGSRPRAFQRAIDEVLTLPLTLPKGGSKSEIDYVTFGYLLSHIRMSVYRQCALG